MENISSHWPIAAVIAFGFLCFIVYAIKTSCFPSKKQRAKELKLAMETYVQLTKEDITTFN